MGVLRSSFARTGTWLHAGRYVSALISDLPKRNGWTIAEQVGDRLPDRTQRLLNRASWDVMTAMSRVRRFAAAGLDQAARGRRRAGAMSVGVLGETGQQKQGSMTAGVKRQSARTLWQIATHNAPPLPEPRYETRDETRPHRGARKCPECRGPLPTAPTGRPPRYCGSACKQRAYRRRKAPNRPA
jgi:hypothetical protein